MGAAYQAIIGGWRNGHEKRLHEVLKEDRKRRLCEGSTQQLECCKSVDKRAKSDYMRIDIICLRKHLSGESLKECFVCHSLRQSFVRLKRYHLLLAPQQIIGKMYL